MGFYNDAYGGIVRGNRLLKAFNVREWSDDKCCTRVNNCFTAAVTQTHCASGNAKQDEVELLRA
jgi:hypothetical protein